MKRVLSSAELSQAWVTCISACYDTVCILSLYNKLLINRVYLTLLCGKETCAELYALCASMNEAAIPLPSAIPPAAITGISTASTTCGTRHMVVFSKKLASGEANGTITPEEFEEITLGSLRKAVQDGNLEEGSFLCGAIAGMGDLYICLLRYCLYP